MTSGKKEMLHTSKTLKMERIQGRTGYRKNCIEDYLMHITIKAM
jgi:hypothetical protein